MNYSELIEVFKKNLTDKSFLIDRLVHSNNPLHIKDVFAASEMLNKANMVFHELLDTNENTPNEYIKMDKYSLRSQTFITKNKEKTIVYVFNYIPENSLTEIFNQCIGTLNSPQVFGKNSHLNIKGLLLNIFEITPAQFVFPAWVNVFLIDGLTSRAMPNIALSSIEDQLSNPIDFYPDAIKTLDDLYNFDVPDVDISINDVFTKI
ncbi:hypothetical protein [Acinetobacter sp. Marseille-Q1618]|uniref:hypothetical protein n=1 Tax=Acinetobacter sp. Marseille-Q1618 TaxID=2697502 RepID=UPI001570E227|nr:hypothetical protein [Acinetobacter sp. Marseille-Q1618]